LFSVLFVFCFVCSRLVCPMLPVSLDCPFLIAPSVFYKVYIVDRTVNLFHRQQFIFFIMVCQVSSPPVFSGVRVTRCLVLYVCFVDRCLSICPFSFGHCVVCLSSIYGFWLPLWYLQTLLQSKVQKYAQSMHSQQGYLYTLSFQTIYKEDK